LQIKKLEVKDLERGFLKTLDSLTETHLTLEEAKEIYAEIDANVLVLVAESGGEIVGTATLVMFRKFRKGKGKAGYLEDMAVRKGFERQGIGSSLIEAAIKEAKARGGYKVVLTCGEHNVPFYEKNGFKRRGPTMRRNI